MMQTSQNIQSIGSLIKTVDTVISELDILRHKVTHLKSELVRAQHAVTPEEEFMQKYPDIQVEPEYFRLVGCMNNISERTTDKELILEAMSEKY
jgi:hypothetical protein